MLTLVGWATECSLFPACVQATSAGEKVKQIGGEILPVSLQIHRQNGAERT
jgi:hypothetical protein